MTIEEQAREDEAFMRRAISEAKRAETEGEVPIGAVVVCEGRIVARAHNLTETLHDVTAHAEMQAITSASNALGGKYLHNCTIYVTVEPCLMCAGALFWSQISRIVYGADDPKRGFSRYASSIIHPKTTLVGGVLSKECSCLVTDFFRTRRST